MRRFTGGGDSHNSHKPQMPPVEVFVDEEPVYFIGPATRDNPMSHVRTRLMGKVVFNDPKIKWNRVTLQFSGKARLNIHAQVGALPREMVQNETDPVHLDSTMQVCKVEKELIFSGEKEIEFGLHLPTHLPPSIQTQHAQVDYTLVASFSAGTFFKKYRIQHQVVVKRHYLPGPSAVIPCVELHDAHEWFEWSLDVPKAVAIEAGEIVVALRWSVEKERVEVDRVQLALEEAETYRFSLKNGVHNLPPFVYRFPASTYQTPSFSSGAETHFIRTPIPFNTPAIKVPRAVRAHHFDPFLEISHRLHMTIHFASTDVPVEPVKIEFPIIVTDYPPSNQEIPPILANTGGSDEAVSVDLDLPEYTPRYEQESSS